MTNEAAEKRRAYYKAWRAANPEKVKANNARYWERKAERERKKAGEQNERETVTSQRPRRGA